MKNRDLTDFIFEAGTLANTQRSGLSHLGMGEQSLAEHSFRVACIGHLLSHYFPEADRQKVLLKCLYHDFHESRTGDLNALHKKYCRADDSAAIKQAFSGLPIGDEVINALDDADEKRTTEAIIAKDADTLEWLAVLVEQKWNGSAKADYWISLTLPRLSTAIAKQIGKDLIRSNPDDWWKKVLVKK